MKKSLSHTRVSVKLRKAEFRKEWYLYIESYPVISKNGGKPQRVREYVNRTITTPIWDKSRTARTASDGSVTYKPKRDVNGVILCKSELDQESCIYADKVRAIRQKEYDTAGLYSESEASLLEQKEKSQCDFITYFKSIIDIRHRNSSDSIIVNWNRVYALMLIFTDNQPMIFANIDTKLVEDFRLFLLDAPQGGNKKGTISQNTASTYFAIFKAGLKQAFVDGYFVSDIAAKIKGIKEKEARREHLTLEELNRLVCTPCDNATIKRAALFSALTGLRHCDIMKMTWKELTKEGTHYRINFDQKKTKGVEYMPISEQAYELCGEPGHPDQLVFEGLPAPSWISKPLARWIEASGITKHITFHVSRHTYATLQLSNGTDLFTVSKMLGHTNVRTTQRYTKVVDEKKENAADAIKIDLAAIK